MNTSQPSALPQHRNPSPQRTACAPYNFVPLPEVVVKAVDKAEDLPDHDHYDPNRHTGFFEVILTTRSPLYVRCPLTLAQFERHEVGQYADGAPLPLAANPEFRRLVKNLPDFFYTRQPDQPVIPGSSLRGMLRGLLEIVSYSKLSLVTDKQLFFRSVDDTAVGRHYRSRMAEKVEAGFLHRRGDEYVLRVSQRVRVLRSQLGDVYQGQGPNKTPRWTGTPRQGMPVWVRWSTATSIVAEVHSVAQPGCTEGRLVITGDVPGKKKEFVFLLADQNAEEVPVPGDVLERFHDDDQITQWQERAFPRDQPQQNGRERAGMVRRTPPKEGEPVFFLRENGRLTFFGRAQMFRLPYLHRPLQLVPESLRRNEEVDFAEAMFGFTKGGENKAKQGSKSRGYASRIFVTDATLLKGETSYWLVPGDSKALVPKILATPKPTAFQHYLTQQEPNAKDRLDHYDSPPPHRAVIRGHKCYWHQGRRTVDQIKETDRQWLEANGDVKSGSAQHSQMKPVREGVRFTFCVRFENLSSVELGALCWVLQPQGDPSKEYCHGLGMGKPLGMGAVKLEATLHLSDRKKRYESLFEGMTWQTGAAGPGQSLSERATVEGLTAEFERHLLDSLAPHPPCARLSGLKRIGMLLKLLEWPGLGDVRYMTVQPNNEYRQRPVLPDPSAFGALTGTSVPQASPPTPPPSPAVPPPGDQPGKAQPSSAAGSTVSPPAGNKSGTPPPGPKVKPINKGEREGMLQRKDSRWVAVFASPTGEREGVVMNPAQIPDNADGSRALFYIAEANKHRILARFERLLK